MEIRLPVHYSMTDGRWKNDIFMPCLCFCPFPLFAYYYYYYHVCECMRLCFLWLLCVFILRFFSEKSYELKILMKWLMLVTAVALWQAHIDRRAVCLA